MNNKIYIDNSRFMELVSDLATQITEKAFKINTYENRKIFEGSYETSFTNEAQDYFNDKYTEFEMMFNKTANIYSDEQQ